MSLGIAEQAQHHTLVTVVHGAPATGQPAPTSVSLFDQGQEQVLQAAVTGLQPQQPYVLALSAAPNGGGTLEPLDAFTPTHAGAPFSQPTAPPPPTPSTARPLPHASPPR